MDKSVIRNFAIEARKILMKSAITEAGFYGITKERCKSPIQKGQDFEVYETLAGTENRIFGSDIKRRANLVHAIEEEGFDQVIEETAYTWFNRIIAIRFMEVNDYLPTRIRVLSSETGSNTPDIVTQSLDVELNMTPEELEKVQQAKDNNKYDEAFRLLFIKQCNELNDILPGLFEKTDDYMELLLKLSYTGDGVVRMLVDTVPEDDFNVEKEGQVEIIGWMYQFYNTELNELVYDGNMAKGKIEKELIPAATQLFTPDWPIKYMVDNSLGKIWTETNPELKFSDCMKYYINEQDKKECYNEKKIENISFLDPCMGSGHILVYAFDVFMKMYESLGYTQRDASVLILKNNLFGFDIDYRAYQMAYFAVFMKARFYNRRIFKEIKSINLYYFVDSDTKWIKYLDKIVYDENKDARNSFEQLIYLFENATNIGSAIKIQTNINFEMIKKYLLNKNEQGQISFDDIIIENIKKKMYYLASIGEAVSKKYDIIVTNPPYLGDTRYNQVLSAYVTKYYDDVKTDLSMVMLKKCYEEWSTKDGVIAFITPTSWLSLKSFEKLRKDIIMNYWISSLVDFGTELFDGKIGHNPITAWVVCKGKVQSKTTSIRLVDYCYSQKSKKESEFFNKENFHFSNQNEFLDIPGIPIAYWLSENMCSIFSKGVLLGDISFPKQGLATADNNQYMRLWWELDKSNIEFNCTKPEDSIMTDKKWFPHNKGGAYRKWYGNRWYVINWKENGKELREFKKSVIRNPDYYFRNSIGYSDVTSGDYSIRKYGEGFVFDSTGPSFFINDAKLEKYIMAVMNSAISKAVLKIFCPSLHYTQSAVAKVPIIVNENKKEEVVQLVDECIEIVKEDWDSHEISWDYCNDRFINLMGDLKSLEEIWGKVSEHNDEQRNKLRKNEERINEILITVYDLEELDTTVDDNSLSIDKTDRKEFTERFVSYVIGVLFGRYHDDAVRNPVDMMLISDENFYEKDMFNMFVEYIELKFGRNLLEDNLSFISESLQVKGDSSRDKLKQYFLKDFYSYHCKMYSTVNSGKRPIYWLANSGKQNACNVLFYSQKYTCDTIGKIRTEYLIKVQETIETALKNAEYIISTSSNNVDKAKAIKNKDKYIKQLSELHTYYQALSHIALQRVELDLDDGVRANYAKFQGVEVSNEGSKKQTIDLLAKI